MDSGKKHLCLTILVNFFVQYVALVLILVGLEGYLFYALIAHQQVANTFQTMSIVFAVFLSVMFPWRLSANPGNYYIEAASEDME